MIYFTKVAGVTFEGRQDILKQMSGQEPCRLIPEPDNPHDKNAIGVHVSMAPGDVRKVGFIPKDLAAKLAPILEGEMIDVEIIERTGGFVQYYGGDDVDTASYGLRIKIDLTVRDSVQNTPAAEPVNPNVDPAVRDHILNTFQRAQDMFGDEYTIDHNGLHYHEGEDA